MGGFGVVRSRVFWYRSPLLFSLDKEVGMAKHGSTPGDNSKTPSAKKVSRTNDVSPEVAGRLAELAKEMRQLVFGGNGVPVWGTKFTEIEAEGMNVGLELGRLFMEQSVAEQAGTVPEAALTCDGEAATPTDQTLTATLETPAGEVQWEQPKTRLKQARRDFFPSGESFGDSA
jgi:hypothetical protein